LLNFTFYQIAKNQEIQHKLYQKEFKKPSFDEISNFQYLNFIQESLRMFPYLLRKSPPKYDEILGYKIPKNS